MTRVSTTTKFRDSIVKVVEGDRTDNRERIEEIVMYAKNQDILPQYVRTSIVRGAENGGHSIKSCYSANQDRPGISKVGQAMEVPEETVIIDVKVNDTGYQAMLDSGAAVSVIDVTALVTLQFGKEISTESHILRSFDNA